MSPLLEVVLMESILLFLAATHHLPTFYSSPDITASRDHKCPLLRLVSRRGSTKYFI